MSLTNDAPVGRLWHGLAITCGGMLRRQGVGLGAKSHQVIRARICQSISQPYTVSQDVDNFLARLSREDVVHDALFQPHHTVGEGQRRRVMGNNDHGALLESGMTRP